MEKMELIAPCHFGLESVLKREVLDLGYEIASVDDGRVVSGEMRRQSAMRIFFCARQNAFF